MKAKKNILMILTDQMHKKALGSLDKNLLTPNLDRLAEDGITYLNAYSNNPVCGPFRGNLFTGMYTCDNGVLNNNDPLPTDVECMADTFNKNGYETSFVGKWHLGGHGNLPIPETLRGGFNHFIGYQCYNGFWTENKFYDENDEVHRFDGHRTDITTDLGIERLNNLAKKDEPFLHVIFYQSPHYPEQPSDEFAELYENSEVSFPPNYQDVDPYTPTYDPRSPRPFKYCADYLRYGGNMREYKRLYNAMVSQIDHGVGRIIETLKDLGIYDDTMILFSSDHGDMQGSHGLLNKCLPYEESCGIPLIIKGSDKHMSGSKVTTPVSSIDYYTTAINYADIVIGPELEGRNLMHLAEDEGEYENDYVFAENYIGNDKWIMIRDNQYKLVVDMDSMEATHLFDMDEDPYEMNNIYRSVEHQSILNRLHVGIEAWLSGRN